MTRIEQLRALHNKGRTILFETVYGSKLYGCALPTSDHDIRGVYAPGLYDLVRGFPSEAQPLTPDADLGASDDVLYYEDAMFVDQVMAMKNNCVEILFAAVQAARNGATLHPTMAYLVSRKDDMLSANASGFVGHARQRCAPYMGGNDPRDLTLQANLFAQATVQKAMASNPEAAAWRLGEVEGLLDTLTTQPRITLGPNKQGVTVLHIHTRQTDLTIPLAALAKTLDDRLARFQRTADGVSDREKFKELSTALRMLETAGDLMEHGTITYPIPTAQRHLAIRQGAYTVETIVDWINAAQDRIESVEGRSPLRTFASADEQAAVKADITAELRLRAVRLMDLNA
jgi:hypothetical protein